MGYSKKEILESRKRSLEALKHRIQSESKADNIPLYEVEKKYVPLIKFYKEEIEKMETNDNDATENENMSLKEQMEFFDKTEEEFESTLSNEEKTLLWYDDRLEREEGKAQEKVRNDFKKQISKRLTRDSYEILQLSGFTIDATPYQIGDIVWVRIKGEEYKGKILRLDNNRAYIYCMPLDTTGWINISQLRGKA